MMTPLETPSAIPIEMMAELQEAARRAAQGVRDPEAMRIACESMDRTREEIYRRNGLLDLAVPAIRALREGEWTPSSTRAPG